MKDIIIEKNPKKAMQKFEELFTTRKEILKSGNKDLPKTDYIPNQLAELLHPSSIQVEVSNIVEENDHTKSFSFKKVDGTSFPPFQAGSYITLEVSIDGRIYRRAYSISSTSSNLKEYQITIKKTGVVSNYMLDHCQKQDTFTILGPFGNFHYHSIRDSEDVVFLCGGMGITAIKPMIEELIHEKKVNTISLFYGVKKFEDFLWLDLLEKYAKENANFQVTFLLSEEQKEGYLSGVIDETLLRKLNPSGKSFFLCGPSMMYDSLNEIFKKLEIPNKFIRTEIYKEPYDGILKIEHSLTLKMFQEEKIIPCYENETLLESMERAGITSLAHCTVGVCGFCRSKLLNGEVKTEISHLRKKDIDFKYIHPCVTYPLSDVTLELPF